MADTEQSNTNNDTKSFKPDFKSEINIESIISAPLVAASKANVEMLKGQTRAIIDNCFTKVKRNNGPDKQSDPTAKNDTKDEGDNSDSDYIYEPIMINLTLKRTFLHEETNKQGEKITELRESGLTFAVPVICLMPINSLAIDKVNVDFDMEITSVTSWHNEKGIITRQAQLNGKISNSTNSNDNRHYKNKSTSSLRVNINAGQLPLPTGVLTILDLYVKNIQPQSIQPQKPVKP
ncbi:MAG: DUF2589 domain-containing protein [Sphingobacteriia bacterium]|nr:DUF2589 domain-containing protein [Sphingobacteriia bacterium]